MKINQIITKVADYLQSEGFQRKGRKFFKKRESIELVLVFSSPSHLLYCQYCFVPLFVPFEALPYTYGERMKTILHIPFSNDEICDLEVWQESFIKEYQEKILPFFTLMLRGLLNEWTVSCDKALRCMPIDLERLKVYIFLFHHDLFNFAKSQTKYENMLETNTIFTQNVVAEKKKEIKKLKEVATYDKATRERFFSNIVIENEKAF